MLTTKASQLPQIAKTLSTKAEGKKTLVTDFVLGQQKKKETPRYVLPENNSYSFHSIGKPQLQMENVSQVMFALAATPAATLMATAIPGANGHNNHQHSRSSTHSFPQKKNRWEGSPQKNGPQSYQFQYQTRAMPLGHSDNKEYRKRKMAESAKKVAYGSAIEGGRSGGYKLINNYVNMII
eukprot:TRINITY_DN1160_c0_g1_i4.p1 TRINITY_DN1160_c0_g1~~TRINITY_DN1160_c0_g1_i4.p1  ORF type:complete len:181 (-),score=48.36 TRINITY_DN1160_c0_g1_i4:177-719(-)